MTHRLEVSRLIQVARPGQPAYSVTHSADGQYTAVGADNGVTLFDAGGQICLHYPTQAWPVHLVAAPGDFSRLLVGARRGGVTCLDLEKQREEEQETRTVFLFQEKSLYFADNDLNTLSLSSGEDAVVAVGHYGPALALLTITGEVVWRRHPNLGNATNHQYWSVGLDENGSRMYIASAGSGTNQLIALEARSGEALNTRAISGRCTRLTVLSQGKGVIVVINDGYSYWLKIYDAALDKLLWEREFGEPVTAVAVHSTQPWCAVAADYDGKLFLLNSESGDLLTPSSVEIKSYVNDIAVSDSNTVTAVTQDGALAVVRHLVASSF